MLQTEYTFTLPHGYLDGEGNLHREGAMRRATAIDEVEPMADARVRANEAYLSILLLGRVVTRLGVFRAPGPHVIEQLFASDFTYLQDLYMQLNSSAPDLIETECPTCGTRFTLDQRYVE